MVHGHSKHATQKMAPLMNAISSKLSSTETFALFTFTVLFFSTSWIYYTKSRNKTAPLPPGPIGFPVFGYLPFLRPDLHHQFTDLARTYGAIFKLHLGSRLCVVVNSPALVKELVRNQDGVFSNRYPSLAAIIGTYGGRDIAWAPNGAYWREIRKIFVREMLSSANLRACSHHRSREVRRVISRVKSRIGEPLDVGELAFTTEINVVMSMMWGSTLGHDESKFQKIGAEFREIIGKFVALLGEPNVSDFFPWIARFDLQGVQGKMEKMVKLVDDILEPIVDEGVRIVSEKRRSGSKVEDDKKDFLQILIELKDSETAKLLDFKAIKAVLLDIVIGGTDTTASMVEWVMAALLDNPKIMTQVQKELEEIVGMDNILEESHLPKLKYLNAVVKETFRLYPALPLLIPKCPSHTTQIGGYTIPKDTKVFVNMYAIHRDPQIWDSPLEFRPERFLNQNNSGLDYAGNDFRFLPFGSGRRICAGISLAEKMLNYILGSLLHSFHWRLPEGEKLDFEDGFGIVIKKTIPLVAVPTPRLSNTELYH